MSKILIIALMLFTSCKTIKKNIDNNYKAHSKERANNYKKVK